MQPVIQEVPCARTPESVASQLRAEPGLVLLRSEYFDSPQARYSFLAARPFLRFRSFGWKCELSSDTSTHVQYGDPWQITSNLISRYELLDEVDLPFPLGGCFGFWGYDLKQFLEPRLGRRALRDLELPDCALGYYNSLVAFDHRLGKTWVISTGIQSDGSRSDELACRQMEWWQEALSGEELNSREASGPQDVSPDSLDSRSTVVDSNLSREDLLRRIETARDYIRAGDIYQVNLSQRLSARLKGSSWDLFQHLIAVSPAPFSAFLDYGTFQIASASPELFLRLSGTHIYTSPIKGTRPRSADPLRDAQLAYELQTSGKETAELIMITDLLRNDLGKCCEFGSIHTRDLLQLQKFPQVQHLVSTVEGRLRHDISHLDAFAACFPGGSVTGAPKVRALEIIDELEPTARGPYTGALGYIGFNRESQLSMVIRTALCSRGMVHFPVGAGIVGDSNPAAEYEETLAKARGFLEALNRLGSTAGAHPKSHAKGTPGRP